MLAQLDGVLRTLLMRDVPGFTSEDQVRFQPPDDDWRTAVGNLGRNALNVCLVDLRENRALRSNDSTTVVDAGSRIRRPAPVRIDCHYLISAWSPASVTPATEPALDEHDVLYRAMAALLDADPINPSRVYPAGSAALAALDPALRDADLPTRVVPADGFAKLSEFWSAMGTGGRWKPAIWLVVTVPVSTSAHAVAPLVTTRILEFHPVGAPEDIEQFAQIGGTVLHAGAPVVGADVRLESLGGAVLHEVVSDPDGRFHFDPLALGPYRLHAVAAGVGDASRRIDVPSPDGNYDVAVP